MTEGSIERLGDVLTVGLVFSVFLAAAAVTWVLAGHLRRAAAGGTSPVVEIAIYAGAIGAGWLWCGRGWEVLVPVGIAVPLAVAMRLGSNGFTPAGRLWLAAYAESALFTLGWSTWFLATMPVSTVTRTLVFAGYPLLLVLIPVGVIVTFENWEVLLRRRWKRPREPLDHTPGEARRMVSIHVPTHAEPPEVVIATLEALTRLDYPSFEVIVVDNNTTNSSLWRPVESRCRELGERFRFFHVEGMTGGKAGALNFALRHTASDAEIIASVDADYQAEPDFLDRLVGHFDEPAVGLVQTKHHYRAWERSAYLRMCNWEYQYPLFLALPSKNERDAAFCIGTMCLVRRDALEQVGGWAEWCVTEDWELSIRLHASGYSAVYLPHIAGSGLIPETFDGYKRQRFRWTYGPTQGLKRHLRLFLPWPLGRRSALSPAQKAHHLAHMLQQIGSGLGLLLLPFGMLVAASMLRHGELVPVPLVVWVILPVALLAGLVRIYLVHGVVLGCTLGETLGAMAASAALGYTRAIAGLWGLFTATIPWRRTSKFKALRVGPGALRAVLPEIAFAVVSALAALSVLLSLPEVGAHLLLLIGLGLAFQSVGFAFAPALALLADRSVADVGTPGSD